jgi:DNA-binding NarL/FixJ family response regulator
MTRTRVLVVEDHPTFRLGLATALEDMDDMELVGECERAGDVAACVEELEPDVVILDLNLPDGSGLDVNRQLHDDFPAVRVLLLTMVEDPQAVTTGLRDGARGYLVKGAHPDLIGQALRTVAAGGVVVPPDLLASVMGDEVRGTAASRPFGLTDRQLDILTLMARGLDNHAIARTLHVSEKTVRNQVTYVFTKLQVTTRAEAIVVARRHGIGD